MLLGSSAGKPIKSPPVQAVEDDGPPTEKRLHVTVRNSNTRFLVDSGPIISLLPKSGPDVARWEGEGISLEVR